MKRVLPLFILVMLMVVACKPSVPSEIIQPDDMEEILYDYHVAQAMARVDNGSQTDYDRTMYFMAVLNKHNVTEAEFDSSLVYYYSHVDRFKDIYSRVSDRLYNEGKKLGVATGDLNRYSQYSESGDTANIWKAETDMLLIPTPLKNRYDFVIKADSTFKIGDSFMFQFMTEHIWQSGMKDAVVCIRTTYEGDSIHQSVSHVSVSGIFQMNIPANSTQQLKELRGFIYLPRTEESGDVRQLMFISQIQFIRFHNKDSKQTYESESEEVVAADSMQRVDSTRRSVSDTTLHHLGTGLRSKNVPFRKGGSPDRMVAGPNTVKIGG